jgi:hypothetical protein
MIDGVIGNKSLQASIRRDIIERTDGIPLFVEEMTKAVLEAESEGDARQTAAAVPSSAMAVPASARIPDGAAWPIAAPICATPFAEPSRQIGKFDKASLCVGEAMTMMERSKERWCEPEIHRFGGEIVLGSLQPDAAKAERYFNRALTVARQQQAKSWELRAAMSLARLWRDQGKVQQARELLAPVYGWFTEGFDTRDLKEAKALLEELAS